LKRRRFQCQHRAVDPVQNLFRGIAYDQAGDAGAGDCAHPDQVHLVLAHEPVDRLGRFALDQVSVVATQIF